MPSIARRAVWTSQPQGACLVDRAFGLSTLLAAGAPYRDLISAGIQTAVNNPSIAAGACGLGYKLAKASSQRISQAIPATTTTKYSFIAVVASTGTDSSGYSNVFNFAAPGGASFQLRHTTSNWDFYHQTNGSGWALAQGAGKYVQDRCQVLVGVWDGASINLYIDGSLVGTASAASIVTNPTLISFGSDQDATPTPVTGTYFDGVIACVGYAKNIAWRPDVAKSLSLNPWQIFAPRSQQTYFTTGGDLSTALSGQAFTFAQGVLGNTVDTALTGQSATFAQGALTTGISATLTGQSITLSPGTISAASSVPLTGQAYTFSQGTITANSAIALTGQSFAYAQGSITADISGTTTIGLSGQALSFAQGSIAPNSSVGITGQSYAYATGNFGTARALTGQSFSFTPGSLTAGLSLPITGQSLTFAQGAISANGSITRALTGQAFSFTQGTPSASLSVSVAGQPYAYSVGTIASQSAIALTGQSTAFVPGVITASGGGFTGSLSPSDIAAIADAVWAKVLTAGLSAGDMQRIYLAALVGKTTGLGTSHEEYLAQDGTTVRIAADFDANSNRTSVTLNGAP